MSPSSAQMIPPHDLEAERAVLGALMLGGSLEGVPLTSSDFYRGPHALVFDALMALRSAGEVVDAVVVAAELEAAGHLERVGGKPGLLEIQGAAVLASNAPGYARIVLEKSRARSLIRMAEAARVRAYEGKSADQIIADCLSDLSRLVSTRRPVRVGLSDAVSRRLDEYLKPREVVRIPGTSIPLHFGDVCVLGGRPGAGKTAIALQAADEWRKQWSVLFMSFEMSIAELSDRFIMRASGAVNLVTPSSLDDAGVAQRRRDCSSLLGDDNLQLVQAAGMGEAQTMASIREFAARGGRIVCLDYLQIAYTAMNDENTDLSRFMRSLQSVAKQCGVLVLALSQFSRAATDARPDLQHLRGSGTLEQEAATVGLLWVPGPEDQRARKRELADRGYGVSQDDPRSLLRLDWRKVRHGKQACDYLLFCGETMRFEPVKDGQ